MKGENLSPEASRVSSTVSYKPTNILHNTLINTDLEGVEVGLQTGLLLHTRGLVVAAVEAVLLQLLLQVSQGVVGLAGLEPRQGAADPFQQVGGEALVLLHQPLVLLVDLEDLADAVGSHLRLPPYEGQSVRGRDSMGTI